MAPRDAVELARDRAVLDACERVGLKSDDAFHVKNLMRRSPASWPACCGSGCQPCSEDLICAAMMAKRAIAELESEGQTDASESKDPAATGKLAGSR